MPRRSELLDEERNYLLVKREKEDNSKFIKQALSFLFSQVGVILLGLATAYLGKFTKLFLMLDPCILGWLN